MYTKEEIRTKRDGNKRSPNTGAVWPLERGRKMAFRMRGQLLRIRQKIAKFHARLNHLLECISNLHLF